MDIPDVDHGLLGWDKERVSFSHGCVVRLRATVVSSVLPSSHPRPLLLSRYTKIYVPAMLTITKGRAI